METAQNISEFWPVFLSFIGLIIWLVRLEGRINQGDRDHSASERADAQLDKRVDIYGAHVDQLESKVAIDITQIKESLARMEGALGIPRQQ